MGKRLMQVTLIIYDDLIQAEEAANSAPKPL